MKISTIVIIVLLIISLYYYTSQKYDVVATAGKAVYDFMKDVATGNFAKYQHKTDKETISEKVTEDNFAEFLKDIKSKLDEWRSANH